MKRSYSYKPVQFFLIANLITWITWLTAAYFSYQPSDESNKLITILEVIGLFAPFGAALWMILTSNSKELKQNFYDRLLNLKLIKLSSIVAIFLIMPATMIISVIISHLFFGQSLDQLTISKAANYTAGLLPVPLMLFGAALIEELGWKGYGVESLRDKHTFFTVTIIYAALWAFWHIPSFFINGYYQNILIRTNPLFALNFMVSVFPVAFIGNWLWYTNRGNIFIAVLFHAVCNFQGILLMGQVAKCIETVMLIIVTTIILSLNKKIFFERFPEQIGYYGRETQWNVSVR